MPKKAGRPFNLDRYAQAVDLLTDGRNDPEVIANMANLSPREKQYIWDLLDQEVPCASDIARQCGVARQAVDWTIRNGFGKINRMTGIEINPPSSKEVI